MKTIDEIINNENYKKLNNALIERVIEIAEKIKNECFKLDLDDCDSFRLGGCTFQVRKVESNSGYYQYNLYMDTERDYVAIDEKSSYYYMNDFNCWIKASNNSEKLYFLQHAKAIFADIDAEKKDRCKSIETALKDTENL